MVVNAGFKKYTELLCFLALLLYTVFFNSHSFYYDEPYYLHNVDLLTETGLNAHFLKIMNGPAGPLHALLFRALQIVTGHNVLFVRLVNIFLLLLILILTKKIFKLLYPDTFANYWQPGMMNIPMVYVCAGMALTEMPALFMLSLSFFFFIKSDVNRLDYRWMLSGLCLSLAILGRQPYLLLYFPCAGWFLYKTLNKRRLIPFVCYTACCLLLPVYVFSIWKGLVPMKGGDLATQKFINIPFLFLGLGYAFLVTVLLNRKFIFHFTKKHFIYILIAFVAVFFICYVTGFRQPLMMTVASRLLPPALYNLYGVFVASILVIIGVIFLLSVFKQLTICIDDPHRVVFLICLLLVVLSCAKITHQFSSRYVFQAAIFFVLVNKPAKADRVQFLLSIAGALIGMLTLYSYRI